MSNSLYAQNILEICKKAGRKIQDIFDYNPGFIDYDIKKSGDVVSRVDIEVEAIIKEEILLRYPNSGFVCEESGTQIPKDCRLIFYIDPIDGTFNFVNGLPFFAISVGVAIIENFSANKVTDKDIVAGVVYAPILQEAFWASYGDGAFFQCKNGKIRRLKVRQHNSSVGGLFTTGSFSSGMQFDERFFKICNEKNLHFRVFGSISLELANVAMGRSSLFASKRSKPWDIAAGSIIARESNCLFTDFYLSDVDLSQEVCEVVCADNDLHSCIISQL